MHIQEYAAKKDTTIYANHMESVWGMQIQFQSAAKKDATTSSIVNQMKSVRSIHIYQGKPIGRKRQKVPLRDTTNTSNSEKSFRRALGKTLLAEQV